MENSNIKNYVKTTKRPAKLCISGAGKKTPPFSFAVLEPAGPYDNPIFDLNTEDGLKKFHKYWNNLECIWEKPRIKIFE